MAIYHAALIAESSGANSFQVRKPKIGSWCSWSVNSHTGQKAMQKDGPKVQLRITILDNSQQKKLKCLIQQTQKEDETDVKGGVVKNITNY